MATTLDVLPAFLAASRSETELFHFLLHCSHSSHMLHAQLFASVLEFIDAAFHFFKVGVDLCPILVVHVHYLNQTFLQHRSFLLRLNARVIQTAALFNGPLTSTIATDCDSDITMVRNCTRGIFSVAALRARNAHWFGWHL